MHILFVDNKTVQKLDGNLAIDFNDRFKNRLIQERTNLRHTNVGLQLCLKLFSLVKQKKTDDIVSKM